MQMIKHSRFVEAKLGENAALFPFRIYFRSWLSLNRNCYARLSPRVIKEQGRGVIHRSEGRDRAYRPEIVNSITVFRNERLNGGIHAESKRFSKSSGTERKGFEAFYELRDGFVRMMGCWGRDWVGRRGTVISGSCRKLTVLPPFDSRESIFQVRSCPLTQLKLCVTEGNNNSAAVNVRSTTFWVHFSSVYAETRDSSSISSVSIRLANRLLLTFGCYQRDEARRFQREFQRRVRIVFNREIENFQTFYILTWLVFL